jgi:cell division protein FtsI/penicillin-binding protein 2
VIGVRPGAKPQDVVTTLRIHAQQDAAAALGGKYGGVVVLDPKSGAVEASVGLGMEALQPPGSSFKTVTAAAALQSKVATLDTDYPYARFIELNGWKLHNFHKESCGGSFILAFAVSCNSVFAPVADQVGAARMVAMAKLFGFNTKPSIRYPVPVSVTPRVGQLTSDLSLGTVGIGQGGVGATALQMASVAATIGSQGIYRAPYIVHSPSQLADHAPDKRVIPADIAADVRTMMEAVVTEGTGTSAAVPGYTVAGKTGTAEVGVNRPTDAWFIAFAPAIHPRVAVAVLVAGGGVGGEVAAPIAGQVLADNLH